MWLLMQNTIGGNACKQALATEHYCGQKRVLEIGCSVGNISAAFCAFPGIEFTGIDIDPCAIDLAKHRFRDYPNFNFSLNSLEDLSLQGKCFDYVLFAGILHHVNNDEGLKLLRDAVKCIEKKGMLVIYEPEALKSSDSKLMRFFYNNFEQGLFLRSRNELCRLVKQAGCNLRSIEDRMVSPGIINQPYVALFNLLVGSPATKKPNGF